MMSRFNDPLTYDAAESREAAYAERQERTGRFAPLPSERFVRVTLRGKFALTDSRTGERCEFDLSTGGEIDAWLWRQDQLDKQEVRS